MENNNIEAEVQPKEPHRLHQVTPVSKYLAMTLFIILPFLGGWIGYTYAPEKVVEKVVMIEKKTGKKLIEEFAFGTALYSPLADGGYRPRWYEDDTFFYCEEGKGVSEAKLTLPVEIHFTAISDSPDQFMVRDADPNAGEIWIRNSDQMFGTLLLKEVSTGATYDMNCNTLDENKNEQFIDWATFEIDDIVNPSITNEIRWQYNANIFSALPEEKTYALFAVVDREGTVVNSSVVGDGVSIDGSINSVTWGGSSGFVPPEDTYGMLRDGEQYQYKVTLGYAAEPNENNSFKELAAKHVSWSEWFTVDWKSI